MSSPRSRFPHGLARALGLYQLVLQGSMAAGGVLWGAVASHAGIPAAVVSAALLIALRLAAAPYFLLIEADALKLDQTSDRPAPVVVTEPDPDSGPVLVTLEYDTEPQSLTRFSDLMREVRFLRRRNGASFCGLFSDLAEPRRYIEYFVVESWLEHLRQHARVTVEDSELLAKVRELNTGKRPPKVTHQIAALGSTRIG